MYKNTKNFLTVKIIFINFCSFFALRIFQQLTRFYHDKANPSWTGIQYLTVNNRLFFNNQLNSFIDASLKHNAPAACQFCYPRGSLSSSSVPFGQFGLYLNIIIYSPFSWNFTFLLTFCRNPYSSLYTLLSITT